MEQIDKDLLDDVALRVINSQIASTSDLQRTFRVGFSVAARLLGHLHDLSIVGPPCGIPEP